MERKRSSVAVLLAVTFLFWASLYLYTPTLPNYVQTKSVNLSMVGLVLSMYGLWMAVARLPMGVLGDAAGGVKGPILAGILLAAAGAFVMGRGNTLLALAFGRALTGISAGTWVILIVVFSSLFDFEHSVYASSLLTFAASFGRLVATSLTGVLNRAGGYPLAFFLASLTGVLSASILALARVRPRPRAKVSLEAILRLGARRDVLLPSVISLIMHYGDWTVTFGFFTILADSMGASDPAKSLMIGANIAAIAAANLLTTLLLRRFDHRRLLAPGAFLFFLGMILIARAGSLRLLFAGTVAMGFAFGVVYPILMGMSIRNVEESERTTAMGIHQSVYAVGMFVGPWLSGALADSIGIRSAFAVTSGFFLVSVNLFIYLVRRGPAALTATRP